MADVFEDPHYRARETLLNVVDEEVGQVAIAAPVPRMSETPGRVVHTGRPLGADTETVLTSIGYSQDEIVRFRAEGAW
jgi:crotonobetainyl-CoA:carnitine CoA-transferase CaiB-like acyl-CoA transferase